MSVWSVAVPMRETGAAVDDVGQQRAEGDHDVRAGLLGDARRSGG